MASLAYFKRTLPAPTATADGFVCVLNEDWFLQANVDALDGTTFANGGGNLIVYEDAALTSRLSVDVMSFVTGASPSAEVWIRLPIYSAAKDVYISADDVQTTQPLPSDTYGQYATYQDDVYVTHDGLTDRAGNYTIFQDNFPLVGVSPWGGNSVLLNGSSQFGRSIVSLPATRPLTYSAWVKASNVSATEGVFGAYSSAEAFKFDSLRTRLSSFRFWNRNGAISPEATSSVIPSNDWKRITGTASTLSSRTINVDGTINTDSTNMGAISHSFDRISYGRFDDSSPGGYFQGELAGMRVTTRILSDSFLSIERLNQIDPANFGTSSDWTIPSVGSVDTNVNDTISKPDFSAQTNVSLPSPDSNISLDISKPEFSASTAQTIPLPESALSIDISKPVFSSSATVTLPSTSSNVGIEIQSPAFSGFASATLPSPESSIDASISKPQFSSFVSVSTTDTQSVVATDITKPIFSSFVDVTEPQPISTIDFSIDSPAFSAQSLVTLPAIESSVQLEVSKPVFSANIVIGEIDIIVADDAKLSFTTNSNALTFNTSSNTLIFKG